MAYNYNKKPVSEHVYGDTVVWQCSACNCWSKLEFILVGEPNCPICNSKMVQEIKNIRIE